MQWVPQALSLGKTEGDDDDKSGSIPMTRRDLLRLMLASAAAEAIDVERLLWVPKPIVTVPAMPFGQGEWQRIFDKYAYQWWMSGPHGKLGDIVIDARDMATFKAMRLKGLNALK